MAKLTGPTGGFLALYEPIEGANPSSTLYNDGLSSPVSPYSSKYLDNKQRNGWTVPNAWNTQRLTQDLCAMLTGRCIGYDCVVTIRVTNRVRIQRILGRVVESREQSVGTDLGVTTLSPVHIVTLTVGPVLSSEAISVYLDPDELSFENENKDCENPSLFIQTEVRYTGVDGLRYYRVKTQRWETTNQTREYIRSLRGNIAAVLLGKRACLECEKLSRSLILGDFRGMGGHLGESSDADEALKVCIASTDASERGDRFESGMRQIRGQIDTYLRSLLTAVDSIDPQNRHYPALEVLPEILYYIRQGPLLGLAFQGSESSEISRKVFLNSSVLDSLLIAMPTLHSFDCKGYFEVLPLSTLAMQPDRIILLDHFSQIIIWIGSRFQDAQYGDLRKACKEQAQRLSRDRAPSPEILEILEGHSAERWLEARLSPGHRDARGVQIAYFPEFDSEGGEAIRRDVCSRLARDTREVSITQYLESLAASPTARSSPTMQ